MFWFHKLIRFGPFTPTYYSNWSILIYWDSMKAETFTWTIKLICLGGLILCLYIADRIGSQPCRMKNHSDLSYEFYNSYLLPPISITVLVNNASIILLMVKYNQTDARDSRKSFTTKRKSTTVQTAKTIPKKVIQAKKEITDSKRVIAAAALTATATTTKERSTWTSTSKTSKTTTRITMATKTTKKQHINNCTIHNKWYNYQSIVSIVNEEDMIPRNMHSTIPLYTNLTNKSYHIVLVFQRSCTYFCKLESRHYDWLLQMFLKMVRAIGNVMFTFRYPQTGLLMIHFGIPICILSNDVDAYLPLIRWTQWKR